MAGPQQIRWQDVQQVLGGQPVQQVTFARNVVMVGANQGGVINIAPSGQRAKDRIAPRDKHPHILPRAVPGFLDREQEQGVVGQALARGQVVDLHGPDGMGKTALISQTMQGQLPGAFPDGMVYLSARHETREDLLQDLMPCFFEMEGNVKVTGNDVRRHMAGRRALVVVDDANYFEEGEAEDLAQVLPQCALLIAGREQQVWQGEAVPLQGLPGDDAVALFEQHWGPVSAENRPTVEAVCDALDGVPLAVIKTATIAATRRLSLAQVLEQVQPRLEGRDPMAQAFWTVASRLSQGEQRLLGALAAAGGATVGVEALPAISGLSPDKIGEYLGRLEKMGIVHAHSPRYGLDDGLRPYALYAWAGDEIQARAASYYLGLADKLQGPGEDGDEENVMVALGYYLRHQQWRQVVRTARAVDGYLAITGRWGQWQRRLKQGWQAARHLGDRATEAWAQNQLGIIAMSVGDVAAAEGLFQGALGIWQALGDDIGVTIARWNLQVLLGPPPLPPGEGKPPAQPGGSPLIAPLAITAVALVVVLVGLIVSVAVLQDHATPTARPPITEVFPQVELWLAAGCDEVYSPDGALPIRVWSSVEGRVDVYWTGPQGDRQSLFEEQLQAGQTASWDWDVPREDGAWMLEAELNQGQAVARCGFAVEVPVEPQVQIWLDEGCDRSYGPGERVTVRLQSNVEGQAEVYWQNPQGERRFLFAEMVQAHEVASRDWDVPEGFGAWMLEAMLSDGQASYECPFFVADEAPPPAPILLKPVDGTELLCSGGATGAMLRWQAVSDPSGIVGYEVELVETPDYPPVPTTSTLQIWGDLAEALVNAECGDAFSWRVRAVDGAENMGEWSETWSFRFLTLSESDDVPPPTPYAVSPGGLNSAKSSSAYPCSSVILEWHDVHDDPGGIQGYRVSLQRYDYDSEQWRSIEPYFIVYDTAIDVGEWLSIGYEYRWRVWAIDNAGNHGDPSSWRYFHCPIG